MKAFGSIVCISILVIGYLCVAGWWGAKTEGSMHKNWMAQSSIDRAEQRDIHYKSAAE